MPRMMEVEAAEVEKAGYTYNSSVNPTWLPGRYNNLKVSRRYFPQGNVLQIPASVSPWRIPLFWLSFHNFPVSVYRYLAKRAIKKKMDILIFISTLGNLWILLRKPMLYLLIHL